MNFYFSDIFHYAKKLVKNRFPMQTEKYNGLQIFSGPKMGNIFCQAMYGLILVL